MRVRTGTAALGGGCGGGGGGGGGMEQRHGEAPHSPGNFLNSSSSSAGVNVMEPAHLGFLLLQCFTSHQPLLLTFVSWRSSDKDDGDVL